jgi:hypothetical protein
VAQIVAELGRGVGERERRLEIPRTSPAGARFGVTPFVAKEAAGRKK